MSEREISKHGVEQLSTEEAVALFDSGAWKDWTDDELFSFQLFQDCLCVPFDRFHRASEIALKRSVWTHEFAHQAELIKEYWGDKPKPTFEEIVALIPADKRLVVFVEGKL